LTQEALADAVQLEPIYFGQIEIGQRNPTLEVIERIARVLKTGIWSLSTPRVDPNGLQEVVVRVLDF
jgi:transcriptional regulator with XRE-family HTH domain